MARTTETLTNDTEAVLRVFTAELGLFTITGTFEDIQGQNAILEQEYRIPEVRNSTFNRVMAGGKIRRIGLFSL